MNTKLTSTNFTIGLVVAFALGVSSYALLNNMQGKETMSGAMLAQMEPAAGTSAAPAPTGADATVIAKVDGKDITMQDVKNFMETSQDQMAGASLDQIFPMIQEQLVMGAVISNKAAAQNLEQDPVVQTRLAVMKDNVIRATYLEREVNAMTNDDALKAKYDEFAKSFKPEEEVSAQHILVDDEAKAKEVIKKLKAGAKFEDLVKEYSKDKGAKQDGDLGYFRQTDMVKEFADAAFSMKKGEISEKPAKTNFGFHVIKVNDRRMSQAPAFDDVKAQLKAQGQREALNTIIGDLRKGAKIELFGMDGKPVAAVPAAAATPADQKAVETGAASAAPASGDVAAPAAANAPAETKSPAAGN